MPHQVRPSPHELMRAQVDRLASMASLSNVQLGIIPLDREALDAYMHPFIIWELEDETLVTVKTDSILVQVHEPEEVRLPTNPRALPPIGTLIR